MPWPGLAADKTITSPTRALAAGIAQHSRQLGQGPLPPTTCPQQSCPHHNRRVHIAYTGDTPGTPGSDDQEDLHFWAPRDNTYIQPLLQDQEKELNCLILSNKHRESGK